LPISDATRRATYDRAKGQCECTSQHQGEDAPHHGGRCETRFTFASGSGLTDWWEANFLRPEAEGGAELENVEALCGVCYQLVKTAAASG